MTDPTDIPAGHHGLVWVFTVAPGVSDPLGLLGLPLTAPDRTEVVDLDILSEVGFAAYLTEAAGFDETEVAADAPRLDALRGRALLVFSSAIGPGPARFAPAPGLTLIARYGTPPDLPDLNPLRSSGAKGLVGGTAKAPMSDARIGGMVATVALLVMFALVALLIWSAG